MVTASKSLREKAAQAKLQDQLDRETRAYERTIETLRGKLQTSERIRRSQEQEIADAFQQAHFLKSIGPPGRITYKFKPKEPSGKATAVVNFNDWHCEENVDPKTINGANEFNLTICDRRIKSVVGRALAVIEAERKISNIRDLVVGILGDMITGGIHEDLSENNFLSPTKATRWAQIRLRSALETLAEQGDFNSITVVTCFGNHGRTTKKPRIATMAQHSFEWLMYYNLLDHFAGDKRFRFKIEEGYHNWLNIQGKAVRFHHGDWIKYQGGVGGISIPVNKAIAAWNQQQKADHDFFAHWHQFALHRHWTACNCLIGYNAYAKSIKAEFSDPSQTLAIFDRDRPTPVCVKEIYCN